MRGKKFTAEEKIHVVLEELRGELSVAQLCRRGGITPPMYYRYSKVFLDRRKAIKIAMLYPAGVVGMAVAK